MAAGRLRRRLYAALMGVGAVLWLAALLLLAQTAQSSAQFDRLQNWILLVNAAGVVVLLLLIGASLLRLVRDYRQHVAGARLKARMLGMFILLAVLPLLLVYYYAVQFINRGIDSWFSVDVEQGLVNAIELSRLSLDLRTRDYLERTQSMAREMAAMDNTELLLELSRLRRDYGATDITVFGPASRIIGTSSAEAMMSVPALPTDEVMFQLRQRRPFVNLEPVRDGDFRVRVIVPVPVDQPGGEPRVVQTFFPLVDRLAGLAETVEQSYTRFKELEFLRTPLKYTFTLTLTLVLLLSLLGAVYGALFFSRRLVAPIQQLVAGTRAVARGDFDTRLPVPARDEIGLLVNSFNDMTRRLARAREEAQLSEQRLESERTGLAIILARLSTGVLALEPDLTIRVANQAAGAILDVDVTRLAGKPLADATASDSPLLARFAGIVATRLAAGEHEWREQVVLQAEGGRRVLMCACTLLPGDDSDQYGHVVVFDDITTLLQAQRDAAWGEVARRLAHEIKNPLTPIQLSAERLRRRYLGQLAEEDGQLLDRATHTIVQQVEAMKQMVNAFSEYARAPDMTFIPLDLNALVSEIAELYRAQPEAATIGLELDPAVPVVEADAGRIRQILHNLLRNALEALEGQDDAEVSISTRLVPGPTDCVQLCVCDNGPGFPVDAVTEVFEPYVTSKPKGTGLGLAIVKKLVEEHGGRIDARNDEHGGARVSILLPVDETAREAMMSSQAWRKEQRRERA